MIRTKTDTHPIITVRVVTKPQGHDGVMARDHAHLPSVVVRLIAVADGLVKACP
jgi:hypothetical protein